MIYNILGFILLPFLSIYKLIIKTTEEMTEWNKFFFYFLLLCVTLQAIELITYL